MSAVSKGVKKKDIRNMLRHFGIDHFFDEIHTISQKVKGAKGPTIISVLKRLKIPKKYALAAFRILNFCNALLLSPVLLSDSSARSSIVSQYIRTWIF